MEPREQTHPDPQSSTMINAHSVSAPSFSPSPKRAGGWTIPLLAIGISIIACCIIIPQSEINRRYMYQREKLRADLEQIEHQVAVNDEFLKKLGHDPTLAERLAQRQMKIVPKGTAVLDLKADSTPDISPFLLVSVPPPAPMPPYKPAGGKIATYFRDPKLQLYLIGSALMLIAAGLVLGASSER
jgi:hypothetical protein